jgi:hypothetical protein
MPVKNFKGRHNFENIPLDGGMTSADGLLIGMQLVRPIGAMHQI